MKMIFKEYHSHLGKPLIITIIQCSKNASRAAVPIQARFVWAAACRGPPVLDPVFHPQFVHTLSYQFLSLEKEWGERKHSLSTWPSEPSTWPSEPSTQSSSNSPCINPRPCALGTTALGLIQMVICLPLKVFAVPLVAVLKILTAASALRLHVGLCLNFVRLCFIFNDQLEP